jgi:hypothetical protein
MKCAIVDYRIIELKSQVVLINFSTNIPKEGTMNFKNFLSFERMITPIIIKILFYIGLIGSLLGGLIFFFTTAFAGISYKGFGQILGGFILGLLGGLLIIFIGVLMTRIYAELLILVFRINETLTDIKSLLQEKSSGE